VGERKGKGRRGKGRRRGGNLGKETGGYVAEKGQRNRSGRKIGQAAQSKGVGVEWERRHEFTLAADQLRNKTPDTEVTENSTKLESQYCLKVTTIFTF